MKSAVVTLATEELAARELAVTLVNSLWAAGRSSTLVWVSEQADRYIAPPQVSAGVKILTINSVTPERAWFPEVPLINLTRQISSNLRDFEVVYGLTSGHPLMHAIRQGRYSLVAAPYFVAVAAKNSGEDLKQGQSAGAIACRFGEGYVLAHCDLIVRFDGADFNPLQVKQAGVASPIPPILSCNTQSLSALFDKVETEARAVRNGRAERARGMMRATRPSLTICLSRSESSKSATSVLQALDRQTSDKFSVIAVDCSGLIESASAFAQLMEIYRRRGWSYRHEPQRGNAQAIALSVAQASSEYLMFIDTDDVPEPRLVERVLEAAEYSGDDLIEIWSTEISDGLPQTRNHPNTPNPNIRASYGIDLVNAMAGNGDPNPLFLVRRAAFDAVGGYPSGLLGGRERQALAVRVAAAGYHCDVLPEVLNSRRVVRDGASPDVMREGDALLPAFDDRLNTINMQSFAMTFNAIAQEMREKERAVEARQRDLTRRFVTSASHARLRLLLLVSRFPYPLTPGDPQRRWAMIRFLGQRHDLTLATFCSSEQSRQRSELLRYCRSVYAAASDGPELPAVEGMPRTVREHMRISMRDALRAIPSNLYDAALIDSMFLAPFGVEIKTPTILGVPNIESRSLMQAAQADLPESIATGFGAIKREAKLMHDYEDRVWPQFAVRSAVTAPDRDEIQRRSKTGQTILIENGTNPELWLEDARLDTDRVVFFGDLGDYANIDGIAHFWHDIWPHIVRRRPSIEFVVAGSRSTKELHDLAQQPGFVLVEDPSDIRDVASIASISIIPLRLGPPAHLQILDSMALGLPVVSTSIGCAGLSVKDDEHLMVRDNALDFAETINHLLSAPSLWRRLRQNGKAVIEEHYRWDKVLAPLESALWSLAR